MTISGPDETKGDPNGVYITPDGVDEGNYITPSHHSYISVIADHNGGEYADARAPSYHDYLHPQPYDDNSYYISAQ